MTEKLVELIPLQTIRRREEADAEEVVYSPGKDAKSFKVDAKEADRLVKLGAAKRADEVDEDEEAPRKLTRKELQARAAELGISVSELKGTGPKGAATDAELAAAI